MSILLPVQLIGCRPVEVLQYGCISKRNHSELMEILIISWPAFFLDFGLNPFSEGLLARQHREAGLLPTCCSLSHRYICIVAVQHSHNGIDFSSK